MYDIELSNGQRLGLRCRFATEALLIAFTLRHWDAQWVQVTR